MQELRRPIEAPISDDIDGIKQVGDLEINMVEPVPVEVPNPEDLVIAEDLQLDLNQLTRQLYFQRKVEGLLPAIYGLLTQPENWCAEKHVLKEKELIIQRGNDMLRLTETSKNHYSIEVDPGVACDVWLPPPFAIPVEMPITMNNLKKVLKETDWMQSWRIPFLAERTRDF